MSSALLNVAASATEEASLTAAGSDHQFSRLNVIGIFFALQLCQLTQPYGSLLFRGYGGFYWRCNPLASFVEACIIFWHLGSTLFEHRGQPRSTIVRKLQEVAASLLLLRGAIGSDYVGGQLQKLMMGSFLEFEAEGDSTPLDQQQTGEASSVQVLDTPHPSISRQPTLESNRPISDTGNRNERLRILYEAFGSNAMAHKELRIDVFTAFSVLTILIKLVTIRGAGWLTAGALFMVVGWFAVQILLLLLHLQKMNELEMTASVRVARTLDAKLKEQAIWWIFLFAVFHLPFFGCPAYLAAFRPWIPKDAQGTLGGLRRIGSSFSAILIVAVAIQYLFSAVALFFHVYGQVNGEISQWLLFFAYILFGIWLGLSSTSYLQQHPCEVDATMMCSENVTSFFKSNTAMHYVVDRSFEKVYLGTWLIFFLAMISALYFGITYGFDFNFKTNDNIQSSTRYTRKRSSFGNALFVLTVFVLYLVWYDPSQTSKPTWTDILG